MRTIKRSDTSAMRLPKFWINSRELVEIFIKAESPDTPIKAEIEKIPNEIILLEGSKDFMENNHLFSLNFTASIGSVRIKKNKYSKEIEFKEDDRALAYSIASELETHEPWWQNFHDARTYWSAISICSAVLLIFSANYTFSEFVVALIIGVILVTIITFTFENRLFIPKVFSRKQDNFWSRNKDRIVWLVLGAAGTHFVANFDKISDILKGLND
ncbi:MAG: hypothetical protein U0934_04895 [Pseudotabrizicola sp.]|uniref:hypothetical protein n=1 Tax=Pseudotabrizicola sp. TaxID=2939647 RepID=UPI002730A377|nr:hypothetical protein [Pseudotabrizicola sp.]MDP2080547.1 hypothetical protein [Pseudotabrizicola sp.]MDZ7573275.1 hypothetical protein [Pseudotabrizicola sp.]